MNPFWMILADLRKTIVSSLGILLLLAGAFSATVAVSLFDRALRDAGAASAQDLDLVIGAAGSRLDLVLASVFLRTDEVLPLLPASVVESLSRDSRVALLSPVVFADHWGGFPLVGVGPAFGALRPRLALASGRWPQEPFEVIAGAGTQTAVGTSFQGSHGAEEQQGFAEEVHEEAIYRVVGTFVRTGTPWDRALVTPAESLERLHEGSPEAGKVSAVLIKPRDFASAYALRAEYRTGSTTAAFPGEVLAELFSLFDSLKQAISLLSLLFQTLVLAAVLLSLLAALPSKARWIGLLRALGAGPGYIFLTLWLQSAAVFLAAVVVGAAVGWAGAGVLATYVGSQYGLELVLAWSSNELGILAVFWGAGLIGALIPSWVGYSTSVRRSLLGQ